uniref:Uncharacterized protein n=1 Tax=Arundo donax TaxID=35708 RepID=A0A0A8YPQ7_ARUDO
MPLPSQVPFPHRKQCLLKDHNHPVYQDSTRLFSQIHI